MTPWPFGDLKPGYDHAASRELEIGKAAEHRAAVDRELDRRRTAQSIRCGEQSDPHQLGLW